MPAIPLCQHCNLEACAPAHMVASGHDFQGPRRADTQPIPVGNLKPRPAHMYGVMVALFWVLVALAAGAIWVIIQVVR